MIASRLRLIAYGVAIAAVLGVLWHVRSQAQTITTLRAQVGELGAANATRIAERDQCIGNVEIQNTAIADLRAKGEAEQRRADAARAEADRIGAQTQRRVQQAMAAAVPAECPAAMEWLRAEGAAMAREWR